MTDTLQNALHAKHRPPSSADRWLYCNASVSVVPLYPNEETTHNVKGGVAHKLIEDGIVFGVLPDTDDPDMDLNVQDVLDWVSARKQEYGPDCQAYAERRYDIAETGEFGTCDITLVTPEVIHLADYKNGYIMTEAREQMMLYLLGAILIYGARRIYRLTVIQPNYHHIDGTYRTIEVSHDEVEAFRRQVVEAVKGTTFKAGTWCKKSYCPHRGSCQTFLNWCETAGADAYYPQEVNSFDDARLAAALDHAEVLQGIRNELRKEAMNRIINHNREIKGYKIVKSRQNRDFASDQGREACYTALLEMGYQLEDLYEQKPFKVGNLTLHERTQLSVAGVERMVKQKYKRFKRGTWSEIWDQRFAPHIRSFTGGLTLERATDGRPAHTRGSEFGQLSPALGTSYNVV